MKLDAINTERPATKHVQSSRHVGEVGVLRFYIDHLSTSSFHISKYAMRSMFWDKLYSMDKPSISVGSPEAYSDYFAVKFTSLEMSLISSMLIGPNFSILYLEFINSIICSCFYFSDKRKSIVKEEK